MEAGGDILEGDGLKALGIGVLMEGQEASKLAGSSTLT